ncbi:unnamed protein product [Nyctereutes procyonoides]|uniref:(raccoon dog) hypothetical protein n=1 Tax=Nyctereutes procyonoides TaxID=34880 RepID=A0A811Y2I3_NYCPR|nr:unnamed protein product [Nyctereutes procyonoides]
MVGKPFTYLLGSAAAALFFNGKIEDPNADDVYGGLTTVFGKEVTGQPQKKMLNGGLNIAHVGQHISVTEKETKEYFPTLSELIILTASHCLPGKEIRKIKNIFYKAIQKHRESAGKIDDDGRPLTDDEVAGMLTGPLLAAQHTSSSTSAWMGFFLARDRTPQEKSDCYLRGNPASGRKPACLPFGAGHNLAHSASLYEFDLIDGYFPTMNHTTMIHTPENPVT